MSLREKIEKLEKRIKARTDEITKEQIIAHNIEVFDAHFNGGDADGWICVHPRMCKKSAEGGKECGYVYQGVYKRVGRLGIELESVKIFESGKVTYENVGGGKYFIGENVYRDLKMLKNKNGGNTFTLREVAEFDYEHTGAIWGWPLHASESKNKMQAAKEVVSEIVQRHWNNLKKNQM